MLVLYQSVDWWVCWPGGSPTTYMYNGSAEDTHLAQWNGKFLFQNVDWDSPTHLHSSCSDTDLSLWEWHVVPKSVNGDRDFFHWNSCISHQLLVVAETFVTGMPFVVCASPNVHTTQNSLSSTSYLSKLVSHTKLPALVSVPLTPLLLIIFLISVISFSFSVSFHPDITTRVDWA